MASYSVWVGGGEVNNYPVPTRDRAERLAEYFTLQGYDDVAIEELEDN